jgi:dTDP-glucose 4,6-dehydratase
MKILFKKKYDLIYDLCCFNPVDANNLLSNIQPPSHIIFLSTAAVYKKPMIYPLTEDTELGDWDSFGDYGTLKVKAERKFINYSKKHSIKLTIFRPAYLLGKNNYFDRENYYFSRILNNDPILVPGNGSAIIQFAFLDETAQAFALIPVKQKGQIEILNISGNDCISVIDFVKLCGNIAKTNPKIINLDTKQFNMQEEHFYDDFYPFPNLSFIISNSKIVSKYKIQFKPLVKGMNEIYKYWKKSWNGNTKKYLLEEQVLKKLKLI